MQVEWELTAEPLVEEAHFLRKHGRRYKDNY